jgi:chemotaxis protein methyltransferase CheR
MEQCRGAAQDVCALTTNHTFFYREAHHFEHFTPRRCAPHLERLQHGEAVRMWSAGCSSGEEVFSLTMTLLGPDKREAPHRPRDIRILASDIADHALKKAARAVTRSATPLACPDLRDLDQREASGDRPEARVWSSSSG